MSRYYFNIKNGHRLVEPAGLDCRDDNDAMRSAKMIARQIAEEAHPAGQIHISVLDADRLEIGRVPVDENREDRPWGQ
jgi:hypothetical protein